MIARSRDLIEATAPRIDIDPSDGKALLSFETDRGPIKLLLDADAVLLLRDRIAQQLSRRGTPSGYA